MNILVIRTHRLGDILQLTPMLRGLREAYPKGRIYFLTGEEYTPLIEGNPDVDAIIPIPEKKYRYLLKNKQDRYSGIFNEFYDLMCELRQKDFDLIINRQYEWGAVFAHLIGAGKIAGGAYSPEDGFYFEDQPSKDLFDTIKGDRKANRYNLVDWACRIACVPSGNQRQMHFHVGPGARKEAERLIGNTETEGERSLVGIQIGAARSFRQWGVRNFTEVIDWLINEKQKKVVLIGSEEERDLCTFLEQALDEEGRNLINLMGKTSLKVTGAVLERCEFLITGDTGPMHLAAAVGTPVLSLFFGTAYPWETGPYGPGHFVLYSDVPCAPCSDPASCERAHECKEMMRPPVMLRAFETFEAFREGNPIAWECDTMAVRLFVTARDAEGEQVLLPPEDLKGPAPMHDRFRVDMDEERYLPWILLEKGDEIIRAFLEGEGERGFLCFSDYLDQWLVLRGTLTEGRDGGFEAVQGLLQRCLEALHGRDTVALMDAIEYGFKPLLEGSVSARHCSGGRCEDVIR
jgi:ADP-heptose:LPS heptosyltransferase